MEQSVAEGSGIDIVCDAHRHTKPAFQTRPQRKMLKLRNRRNGEYFSLLRHRARHADGNCTDIRAFLPHFLQYADKLLQIRLPFIPPYLFSLLFCQSHVRNGGLKTTLPHDNQRCLRLLHVQRIKLRLASSRGLCRSQTYHSLIRQKFIYQQINRRLADFGLFGKLDAGCLPAFFQRILYQPDVQFF